MILLQYYYVFIHHLDIALEHRCTRHLRIKYLLANGIKMIKKLAQHTVWFLVFTLSNTLLAAELVKNEHKDIRTSNTTGNAYVAGHADGGFSFTVNTQLSTSGKYQQKIVSDNQMFQQMQQRRRQIQQQQLDAYKLYLKNKRQQSVANGINSNSNFQDEMLARRKAYIKHMEERRTLVKKLMDERRKNAEQQRKQMRYKMHQTSTAPELTNIT